MRRLSPFQTRGEEKERKSKDGPYSARGEQNPTMNAANAHTDSRWQKGEEGLGEESGGRTRAREWRGEI